MNVRNYVIVSSVLFALVAVVHLVRIVGQWAIVIDGWAVPMWVSFVGLAITGLLSFLGFRALQQMHRMLS